ncbi:MAG: flippase-like domain-containing protein [Flavobacteriia bacterium]|nr:flippase-like domain-containing protein [Flavobacteriia bacterium]
MSKKLIFSLIKTVLPLLLGTYLIWHSFSGMTKEEEFQFYKFIQEANYFWIIIAIIFGVIAYFSRAYRWKYTLEPLGFQSKFWNRYHAIMIGYLINLTIPRAGEASRSAMLYRSDGIPFSNSFGTIIAERAIDFILLICIALFTAFIGYGDFFELKNQIQTYFGGESDETSKISLFIQYGIISIVLIFILIIFKKPKLKAKLIGFIKSVFTGLFSIFKLKNPIGYIFHTLLIWFCYLAMFYVTFYSSEITSTIPLKGILIGFIAGSLGIILTNGGIGTYPILVGLVVAYYIKNQFPNPDVAFGIGNALGWIIWLSQTLLMVILGVISFILLPNNYKKEDEKSSLHSIKDLND